MINKSGLPPLFSGLAIALYRESNEGDWLENHG